MSGRTFGLVCAAALVMLTMPGVRMGVSQTTAPATMPGRIPQPKAFTDLAAKAVKTFAAGGVHAVGKWELAVPAREGRPAGKEVFAFEVRAAPPRMKAWVDSPSRLTRVSDGRYVYTYRHEPGRPAQARRRALTDADLYSAAGLGGPLLDAAKGYASLAESVRLTAIEPPDEYAKEHPGLTWFRLEPVTKPPHHLLAGTSRVIVGISPADGLMRAMVAELADEGQQGATSSVFFDKVTPGKIKPAEMLLPHEAALAQWLDADRKEPVPAPKDLISPEKK